MLLSCGTDQPPAGTGDSGKDSGNGLFGNDTGAGINLGDTVGATDTGPSSCTSNADCAEPKARCKTDTGECVQCLIEGDCPGGETCKDNGCLPKSCKPGEKQCQDTASLATCNADGKGFAVQGCATGQICHDAACHDIACKPDDKKCATDNRALLVCNEFGTTFVKKPCSNTETCADLKCAPHVCKPAKKTCGDSTTVKTCNPDGLSYTDTPCAKGDDNTPAQSCDPAYGTPGAQAFCADQLCAPSNSFCADNQAKKCAADGLASELLDNCNQNSSAGKPRLCSEGACIELKCKPGTLACLTWASVGKCQADGQSYKKVPCGENSVCQSGNCVVQKCEAGKTFCEGSTVKKCNGFGSDSAFVVDCASSSQTCFKGGCSKVVCAAGTSKCGDSGKLLQKCGPNGYEYTAVACGAGSICLPKDGATAECVKQECEPAAKYCDGEQPKQCNGYGTASSLLPKCAAATICHNGECKKKTCTPGELQCKDKDTLRQCNTKGVDWDVVGCGAGQVCGDKKCSKKLCEPGKAACDGTIARGCDATGLKYAFEKDCAKSDQNCLNGNCVAKYCGDGTCDKPTETCTNCEKDCGKCPPTGCTQLPTAGCSGCTCEACVCQWDPNCCSQLWSGLCAQICQNQCGSTCKN